MATFTINANLGAYGVLGDFVNGSALHVTVSTATTLTLIDNEGDGFTFAGTGLTYSVAGVTGGTFTGLNVFNSTGGTLETATGFSMGPRTCIRSSSLPAWRRPSCNC